MESTIKWQTGEPKETGYYVVTKNNGDVFFDYWMRYPKAKGYYYDWSLRRGFEITAWCKLSDIEPYKEEKE